jgi:hypothetical protein
MRPLGARVAAGVLAAASALVPAAAVLAAVGGAPAGADPPACERTGPNAECDGTNDDPGGPGGPGGGGSRPPIHCAWVQFPDQAAALALWPDRYFGDNTMLFEDCGRPQGNGAHDTWERIGQYCDYSQCLSADFVIPRPVQYQDPAEIAADRWAEVRIGLAGPQPVTSPPGGAAAIIDQPAFVAISNWPAPISEQACDGPVCIRLDAVPSLTFDPGDGSGVVACTGPGTVFDPAGADPLAQAEGACAHVYERRTAGEAAWPGTVTITWTVTWETVTPGFPDDGGTLDPVPLTTDLPREVDEVQGVVVDAEEGLG